MRGAVFVAGTWDTKAPELGYIHDSLKATGVTATKVDLATTPHGNAVDVTAEDVAAHHPEGTPAVLGLNDRGRAVGAMAVAFERYVAARDDIVGIIGAGGTGNTALLAPAMRALPIGVPKVLVSTVASGNVAPYVGPSDIAMMYSVTDVQGLNPISRKVLGNAAHALAGMVRNEIATASGVEKPAVGMTMFGVTTPLVQSLAKTLEPQWEPLVFHATGIGGRSMEKLVESGLISVVLDATTTEVADLLVGGVFPATEDRFGAIARTRVPYVGSCGALDMVNFGAMDTVPERFRDRQLYVHNPQITLMRTTVAENRQIGRWIGEKLNACDGEVRFLLPEGGVSLIDVSGGPFDDPEAREALFSAIEETVVRTKRRQLVRVPHAINDPAFADAMLSAFHDVTTEAAHAPH